MSDSEELEIARDYWRQIYERSSASPDATLVDREEVIKWVLEGKHEPIIEAYGLPDLAAADLRERYINDLKGAPITSPGIDPHAEYILDDLCKRIAAVCERIPGLNAKSVAIGIEPKLGVFASRMGVITTDASIITVGSQLFRFCNVVSKAIQQTLEIGPSGWDQVDGIETMRMKLRQRPDVLSYWLHVVLSFGLLGTSYGIPFRVPRAEGLGMRHEILESMEVFIVAHEFAHHFLKHGRMEVASTDSGTDSQARREEFQADCVAIMLGQSLTGSQTHENFLILSGVGAVASLRAFEMIDETKKILGASPRVAMAHNTHPSAQDRLLYIDGQVALWPELSDQFRHFRRVYGNMMRIAWEEILPIIEELRRR
jgi:hypothetical protein